MATSSRLVVLLCAAFAAAVFAEDLIKIDFLEQAQPLALNFVKQGPKDQSVIYGAEGPNDRVLYHEYVNVPKGFLQVKKKDITYPLQATPNGPTITCIKIIDNMKTGKNAEFKVSSGGLGQKFAIINMKSKRGEPIKYDVIIYGR